VTSTNKPMPATRKGARYCKDQAAVAHEGRAELDQRARWFVFNGVDLQKRIAAPRKLAPRSFHPFSKGIRTGSELPNNPCWEAEIAIIPSP